MGAGFAGRGSKAGIKAENLHCRTSHSPVQSYRWPTSMAMTKKGMISLMPMLSMKLVKKGQL